MPVYQYKCPECGGRHSATSTIAAYDPAIPPRCAVDDVPMRRTYTPPAIQPAMPGHYNPSLGRYVTGEKDFRDGLKAASDEASKRTGGNHNFQPIDFRESAAHAVTAEGLETTNRARHAEGLPTLNLDKL